MITIIFQVILALHLWRRKMKWFPDLLVRNKNVNKSGILPESIDNFWLLCQKLSIIFPKEPMRIELYLKKALLWRFHKSRLKKIELTGGKNTAVSVSFPHRETKYIWGPKWGIWSLWQVPIRIPSFHYIRLQRWLATIPSLDQWWKTIVNHWNQWLPDLKTIEYHWYQWLPLTIPFNGDGAFENHWYLAMVAKNGFNVQQLQQPT